MPIGGLLSFGIRLNQQDVKLRTAQFEHHSDANQPLQIFFGKSLRISHGDGKCS
ncbi:hypothetical protein RB4109 [Rhodopirellula baltica SH 1]|uniref:Uncharacterized protein n=1 Tax=Rhodopirellula baltica (strain DSM 10527 / NCIMB 13988 / SH1) TaxID=243090 RepID=Q7UT49_RHOBA|nr:hypothetical protein RB4109 [Rhodopirellula baltica SH 1]